ncbi:MAG: fibronectin type III domain-containing protein [Gammaproteobacteria bacterium]
MSAHKIRHSLFSGIIIVLFVLLAGCGNGGGDNVTASPSTINGYASKGPVADGTATAYAIANGAIGSALGTATTNADGAYSISIENHTGPVLIEVTGGTYIDEATGDTLALPNAPGNGLTAAVESVTAGQTLNIQVTAVTTQATDLARCRPGGLTADNIRVANEQIGQFFGGLDIINTRPINPLLPNAAASASQAAIDYGLILAGLSQQAEALGLSDPMSVVRALGADVCDGVFDGQDKGAPISLSNSTQLLSTAGTLDLANAIEAFSNNAAQNTSGATPSNTLTSDLQSSTGELPIAPPTGVTADAGIGQVTVSWDAVSGASSYNLYYGTSAGLTKSNGAQIVGVTSPYTVTSLTDGVTYYFMVTANNSSGESGPSNIASATTQAAVPSIAGTYTTNSASFSTSGCQNPADNGQFAFNSGTLTIGQNGAKFTGDLQLQANVAGHLYVSTQQLTGTVSANGALSGSFTNTSTADGQFDTSGNGTFTGQASGNTATIQIEGQDTVGDTCSYTGGATFTRQ